MASRRSSLALSGRLKSSLAVSAIYSSQTIAADYPDPADLDESVVGFPFYRFLLIVDHLSSRRMTAHCVGQELGEEHPKSVPRELTELAATLSPTNALADC